MQERPLSDAPVRIGCVGPQQDRRGVDRAARQDRPGGPDPDLLPGRASDVGRESLRFNALHDVTLTQNANDPRAVNELGLVVQRARNRSDEHRLLRVDRAAEPAVAEVEAAAHVAVNGRP